MKYWKKCLKRNCSTELCLELFRYFLIFWICAQDVNCFGCSLVQGASSPGVNWIGRIHLIHKRLPWIIVSIVLVVWVCAKWSCSIVCYSTCLEVQYYFVISHAAPCPKHKLCPQLRLHKYANFSSLTPSAQHKPEGCTYMHVCQWPIFSSKSFVHVEVLTKLQLFFSFAHSCPVCPAGKQILLSYYVWSK